MLAVTLLSVLIGSGGTWAYFTTSGSGVASAATGTLAAPSITSTTAGAGTMALSWSAVAAPGGQGTVSYYVTRNGGAPAGTCPSSAAPSSATTCTDSGLSAGTYNYTIVAVWRSWTTTSAVSSPQVAFGALDHFSVSAPSSATAGTAFSVTVTAKDAANKTITSYTGSVHFTSSDGQAALPIDYTFTSGDSGSHAFTSGVTLKTSGSDSVNVADTVQTVVTGLATVAVAPTSPASLSLSAASTSPAAGAADNLTITALDTYGNTATSYAGSKSLTFAGASVIGTHSPTVRNSSGTAVNFGTATTITFTSGVASVSGSSNGVMTLYKAESINITVTDGTLSNGSGLAIAVGAASAASLSLTPASTSLAAGAADNLSITALDAYGNTATSYSGSHALTFGGAHTVGASSPTVSNSSGAAVSFGTATTITFTGGAASVSGSSNGVMTLYKAESINITVTDGTLTNGTGPAVTVAPLAATSLSTSAVSTSPTAGAADNLTITALDTYGNTATSYAGSKSLTFAGASVIGTHNPTVSNSSGTAVNFGTATTMTFTSGVAAISGSSNGVMTLYKAESIKITVSDGTLTNGTGLSVAVSAASGNALAITPATLSGAKSATPNLGPFTVAETDAYGNPSTTAETVNLSSTSGTATFGASQFGSTVTSVSITGGTSSTTFFYGDNTTGTPTITAAATGLTSGSQSVTITTGPAGLEVVGVSGTGTPALGSNCTTISASDACTVTGTGSGGDILFRVRFATSGGAATSYSSAGNPGSTLTASAVSNGTISPGTLTIAAGSSTTTSKFTATHTGTSSGSFTVTFGPYTLSISVQS